MRKKLVKSGIFIVIAGLFVGILNADSSVFATVPGTNQLVSARSVGGFTNGGSNRSLISANGKVVVYNSNATNVLPSGGVGIFVRNLASGTTQRVNISTAGVVANDGQYSMVEKISATGRYIIFRSSASNLIDGTTTVTSPSQLYLRDTVTATTTLVSRTVTGVPADGAVYSTLGVSSDGRFIGYSSNATNLHIDSINGAPHLYMLDRLNNTVSIIDRKTDGTVGGTIAGNPNLPYGAMSCDGAIIAFQYPANLIVGDTYSNHVDIYILDRRGGTDKLTNLTKTANAAVTGPSISCNGDFIGFKTRASNLDSTIAVTIGWIRPYIYDRVAGTYHFASATSSNVSTNTDICGISQDFTPCIQMSDTGLGIFAANNSALTGATGEQLYLRDIYSGTTELLSKNSVNAAGNGSYRIFYSSISADGTIAAYASDASNLISGDTNVSTDVLTSLTGY